MPKVLTYKELLENKGNDIKIENGHNLVLEKKKPEQPRSQFEYILLHPDTDLNFMRGGTYVVDNGGEQVVLQIQKGMIKTNDCGIRNTLIHEGFVPLYSREIQ